MLYNNKQHDTDLMPPDQVRNIMCVCTATAAALTSVCGGGTQGESLHCARTAHTLRATFRLCSPRRPRHAPWNQL